MKTRKYVYTLGLVICTTISTYFVAVSTAQQTQKTGNADVEYQMGATLFMQKAAEYRALAYQAYNIARLRLDQDLDKKNEKRLPKKERKMPRAIVVDIDETVLDNSPAQAYNIKYKLPFELERWYAWGNMRKAKPIPGSLDFLNYAVSKGVKVFYVSNRDDVQKQATIDNLKSAGYKDIGSDNVMLRTTESTKEPRRQEIMKKYRIVLLMGDNLDDLSNVFERKPVPDRFAETDKLKAEFGDRFIVLPNAMYGGWESAVYGYERLNDSQKSERRYAALELP